MILKEVLQMTGLMTFGIVLGGGLIFWSMTSKNKKLQKSVVHNLNTNSPELTSQVKNMIIQNESDVKVVKYVRQKQPGLGLIEANQYVQKLKSEV